jgi:phosphatidylinositol-3-phosphatase
VKAFLAGHHGRAVEAMASLSGKRFNLLVASSLVATTTIVAAAATSGAQDNGPLSALIGRTLAANTAPTAPEPSIAPEPALEPSGGSASPAPVTSEPLASPTPIEDSEPPAEETPEKTPPKPVEPPVEAGPIQHVFVISLASSGYDAAFGATPQMPYLATTLRPQGVLLSNYSLLDKAALPNAIATISGQPPNDQTKADCAVYSEFPAGAKANPKGIVNAGGCLYPVETVTVSDQLIGARLRWHAYMEGMADETGQPDSCVQPEPNMADTPAPGGYAAKLNPFVYFHSLLDLGDCTENDVPLSELEGDLKKVETTSNFNYISPNLCNVGIGGQCPAGTPEGAAAADAFLATWVPKILASPAYKKDGLLIVTFGQVNPSALADPAVAATIGNPPKVGTLLLSRFAAPGGTDGVAYDPYSLERTLADLFRLSPLAAAGGTKVKSLAPALEGANGGD